MTQTTKPTPQQVRDYFTQRRAEGGPPPSNERIREMLGWRLIHTNNGR